MLDTTQGNRQIQTQQNPLITYIDGPIKNVCYRHISVAKTTATNRTYSHIWISSSDTSALFTRIRTKHDGFYLNLTLINNISAVLTTQQTLSFQPSKSSIGRKCTMITVFLGCRPLSYVDIYSLPLHPRTIRSGRNTLKYLSFCRHLIVMTILHTGCLR